MPPKRGRGKATKGNTTRTQKDSNGAKGRAKKVAAVKLYLPPELWRMVIAFACNFPFEFDYTPQSARAKAALGLVGTAASDAQVAFDYNEYLKGRKVALQMRRILLLVCKSWNEMAKDYTYATIVISDTSRPLITELIMKFLANPKLADGVRRLELNFSVSRASVELIGAQVRGLLKHCKNVEVIDDHVRREASKRSVSPIEVAAQAAGEIPFAVVLGNREFKTLRHARFSRESTAAFTLRWFVTLMQRLPGIEILCLNDFPGWKELPIVQENTHNNAGANGARRRSQQARRRRRSNDSDDSDSDDNDDDSDADDEEFTPLEPLTLPSVHTLNMAQIRETKSVQLANAFTRYLGNWDLPAVKQLALSIYNAECIPTILLKQIGDGLTTLCLHNFSLPPAANTDNPTTVTGTRPQAIKGMTLEDRKVVFPNVGTVMAIPNFTSPDWVDIFSTPNLETYILSYFPYSPTPHDPAPQPLDPENPPKEGMFPVWCGSPSTKPPWGVHWSKLRAHFELTLDRTKMPRVKEVWLQDCQFNEAPEMMAGDVIEWFTKWEGRLNEVGVKLTGGQGSRDKDGKLGRPPTWTEAKAVWGPAWEEECARAAEEAAKAEELKKEERKRQEKKEEERKKSEKQKAEGVEAASTGPIVEGQTPVVVESSNTQQTNGITQVDNGVA